jgi:hypothetical protein
MAFSDENLNDYFSDEELQQAKETFKKSDRIHALIRRLDAAEEAVQFMYISPHPIDEASEEAYKAWRKACGK